MDVLKDRFPDAPFVEHLNGDVEMLVPESRYVEACEVAKEAGYVHCSCLSAIDWKDRLTLVVSLTTLDLNSSSNKALHIKVDLPREGARVPSITSLWPTANWHERETYDMYGIRFDGHPNFRRILLPDNWQGGHPLLKDFVDKRPQRPRLVRHRYAE